MTEAQRAQIAGRPLLLYDGVCVLCNGLVRFLLRHDTSEAKSEAKLADFRFAPLQSPLALELLRPSATTTLEGVVLITGTLTPSQRLYRRSDAVAQALQLLGSPWHRLGTLLALLPHPLREFGYTIVARLRYRLFGRYATCPIPTPDQRSRILGVDE
jgi:predicted DCC family thiol-disulfide oxidoreductase YuxK